VTAAVLVGSRRAYQLLRLLELGDWAGIDRLLEAPASADEWMQLGLALRSIVDITARRLPDEQRASSSAEAAKVAELGYSVSNPTQLTAWLSISAALAIELLTLKDSDQASRLAFYESRARMSYDLEDSATSS
jgi:hypothetical protein